MQQSTLHKSKQFFALVTKLFIVIGCSFYIYLKLTDNEQLHFSTYFSSLENNAIISLQHLSILLLFSVFNWSLEILKWKTLVSSIQKIDFKNATIQCLASLTASLITPNRIGEYGAKALYFAKNQRKKIVVLNLIGNLFQLFFTLVFGVIGISYFITTFNIDIPVQPIIPILILSIVSLHIFWTLYKRDFTFKGYSIKSFVNFIRNTPRELVLKTSLYSGLRYLIFSHQFYFLLLLFSVDVSYIEAMFAIFSMYFLASIIPMLSIFDIVLKSSVAIWVFSFFNANGLPILSITLSMWILNFVLPSIIGSYFVLTFNHAKPSAANE